MVFSPSLLPILPPKEPFVIRFSSLLQIRSIRITIEWNITTCFHSPHSPPPLLSYIRESEIGAEEWEKREKGRTMGIKDKMRERETNENQSEVER